MKKAIFLIVPLLFIGCGVEKTSNQVKSFAKCYVHKMPAPFWVCYQSSFVTVGKVHADKLSRLKQEEAYSVGVSDLIVKLQSKTKLFFRKVGAKYSEKIDKEIKDFIVLNALQGDSWFSTKEKMIYVEVKVEKNDFRKFLFSLVKGDKNKLQNAFDETF
jgi:hypothetical protein